MPWLRDRLVSDRKSGCWEEGCHGTHGYQNCCCGLCHMENGGLGRETGQSVFGQFYDSPHGRVEAFTVKHYCEMGEHNIFYFKTKYIVLFGTPISPSKMLDSTSLPCMVTVINCPMTLLMCFSVKPSICHMAHTTTAISMSMHVYHGNPLLHSNQIFCLKLVYF